VSTRRVASAATVSAGALVAMVGTFLTWVRSGAITRSSYEIFGLVERLGFSPDGVVGWSVRLWPVVPLLLVLCVVSWWWPSSGRPAGSVRTALTVVSAIYVGGTGLAIAAAPAAGNMFGIGIGPGVTALGGLLMLVGVAVNAIRRERSTRPSEPGAGRS
jgi:hypothetical protein